MKSQVIWGKNRIFEGKSIRVACQGIESALMLNLESPGMNPFIVKPEDDEPESRFFTRK
ncbi:MAG: hypothetical protein GXY14_09870 [Spirochaetes bacterium]|jgi:hypothetical protein|nr:hypothetical protein [Spirochaetota bacterium]